MGDIKLPVGWLPKLKSLLTEDDYEFIVNYNKCNFQITYDAMFIILQYLDIETFKSLRLTCKYFNSEKINKVFFQKCIFRFNHRSNKIFTKYNLVVNARIFTVPPLKLTNIVNLIISSKNIEVKDYLWLKSLKYLKKLTIKGQIDISFITVLPSCLNRLEIYNKIYNRNHLDHLTFPIKLQRLTVSGNFLTTTKYLKMFYPLINLKHLVVNINSKYDYSFNVDDLRLPENIEKLTIIGNGKNFNSLTIHHNCRKKFVGFGKHAPDQKGWIVVKKIEFYRSNK